MVNTHQLNVLYLPRLFVAIVLLLCTVVEMSELKPPEIDRVSLKITPQVQNPNSHIFETPKDHNENRFDYKRIKQSNITRQPVLFEHMTELQLTRSRYIVTSFLSFDDYNKGFFSLGNFADKLINQINQLTQTEMPYYIRKDQETGLRSVINIHKKEALNLIEMLENQKTSFNSIIDHFKVPQETTRASRTKRGLIHKVFDFLFGSGGADQETINQIRQNLEILENNQNILSEELMDQMELIQDNNVQISKNRAVLNTLNRDLIQMNHGCHFCNWHPVLCQVPPRKSCKINTYSNLPQTPEQSKSTPFQGRNRASV